MKKHKISILAIIIVAIAATVFAGCAKNASYAIEGNADIRIGVSATEYDFLGGVRGYKDGAETQVTVDSSSVTFGTAGEYEITYTVGTLTQKQKVYIYGAPTISFTSDTVAYENTATNEGLLAGVTATDTFGGALSVTVSGDLQRDELGRLALSQQLKYAARDEYGNQAEKTRNFTVVNDFKLDDKTVDFADADVTISVGNKFKGLYKNQEKVSSQNYFYQNGILGFEVDYLVALGTGKFEFLVVTDEGYSAFNLTLTDNQPAKFAIPDFVRAYAFADNVKVVIPEVKKIGHQNLSFEYFVTDGAGNAVTVAEENGERYFAPTAAAKYTLTVKAMRGEEMAGEKSVEIFVRGDAVILNETSDCESAIECAAAGTLGASEVNFTADKAYGDELGSARITGILDKGTYLIFNLKNPLIASTNGYYGLEFNLFNDTGAELELYTYFAQILTIPADAQWTKIRLTMGIENAALQGVSIQIRVKGEAEGNLMGKSVYISDIFAIKSFGTISSEDITGTYRGTRPSAGDGFDIVLKENNEMTFGSKGSGTPHTGTYSYYTDGTIYFCVQASDGKYYSGLGTVGTVDGKKYLEVKDSWLCETIRYDLYEATPIEDVSAYAGVYAVGNFYFIFRNDKTFEWGYSNYHNSGTYVIYDSGGIECQITQGAWYKKSFVGIIKEVEGVKCIEVDLGVGNQTYTFLSSAQVKEGTLAEQTGHYEWTDKDGVVWVIEIYADGSLKWGFGGNLYDATYVIYDKCVYIQTVWNNGQAGIHWFGTNSDGVATISGNVGVRDLIVYERTADINDNPEVDDVSEFVGVYTLQSFYYVLNADKTFTWGYAANENTGTYAVYEKGNIELTITDGSWYKKNIAGTIAEKDGVMTVSADIGIAGVQDYGRIAADMEVLTDISAYEGVYTWVNPANAGDTWFIIINADGSATWGYGANGFEANATVYKGGAVRIRNKYDSGDGWRVVWYKVGESNGAKTLTTDDNDRGVMAFRRVTSVSSSNEVSDFGAYYGTYSGSGFVFEWTETEMKWGWGDNRYTCEYKLYSDGTLIIKTNYSATSVFVCKLQAVEGGYSITGNTGMNGVIAHIATIG